jgi:predicted TIM-barrel fold metal-dependent hydrolase
VRPSAALILCTILSGCNRSPPISGNSLVDSEIVREIGRIRAIDHHAHPVSLAPHDRDFDALPVDNMEPESEPVYMRPEAPGLIDAWRALWAYPYQDATPEHTRELAAARQRVKRDKGDQYPSWVLDQIGVEVMLSNRVTMGPGVAPPRFRWVPYADALLFPLDNSKLAAASPDRKAFFADEDILLRRYLRSAALEAVPRNLDDYLARVVTPTLEGHQRGGAVAEKFEAAYLRSLEFVRTDRGAAGRVYAQSAANPVPSEADYKILQDYLFWYIAAECGRLGMAVHLHVMAGAGGYFDVGGANPLLLEPVLNAPELRKTNFVMVHGGWPFTREITPLLNKPNAYLDFSSQDLMLPPATLARSLQEWLEWTPEKVMFGTDAYPYSGEMGWEESAWLAARRGREALAIALTAMLREDGISRQRAVELARMVLRDNARKLYGLP